jgi:hypothetical protein
VCPRAHLEHCVSDLPAPAHLRMIQVVRLVALAAEDVLPGERIGRSGYCNLRNGSGGVSGPDSPKAAS